MNKEIDGLKINYIVEGDGETVVVLHGWGASIETVMPIVNGLKDRFKVYAIDLPGFGDSDEPLEVMDSFVYADIVKKFIEDEKLSKVKLVGHSFGGKLSIILSAKYPELVDKVVLIDSAGLIPKRALDYYIKVYGFKTLRFFYKNLFFWLKDEEKLEKFYKKFGSDDYQDSTGIMRRILVKVVNEDLSPILKDIEASTLLVWGDKDEDTPLYMGKIMEQQIKDSGLVVLEGTGHYSYLDDYYKFKRIINSFF